MKNGIDILIDEDSRFLRPKQTSEKSLIDKLKNLKYNSGLLIIPPILFILVFLAYPLLNIFIKSIYNGNFTAENYLRFFSDGLYLRVLLLTLKIGAIVTLTCLLLAYPVAYTMTFVSKHIRGVILIAIMIPFWTSLLVRTYSWMVLLQTQGVLNQILLKLGFIDQPLKLIHNTTGVVIGMTHVLLPYMILCLYSCMQGIDKNLLAASSNLGATPFQTFYKIFLPLSLSGIASGSILVFIMGIGYFITPSLLGGQKDSMISQLIQTQVGDLLNWGFASAIAFVLLAVTLLLLIISKSFLRLEKLW